MLETNPEQGGKMDYKKFGRLGAYFIWILLLFALFTDAVVSNTKRNQAHAAKPDSCKIYADKAREYLLAIDKDLKEMTEQIDVKASLSAAHSGYYQVCRDLERRESQ